MTEKNTDTTSYIIENRLDFVLQFSVPSIIIQKTLNCQILIDF